MRQHKSQSIELLLCGDVMTGRGIDQILPHAGDPMLYEPYIRDARDYVQLAEAANGPIPWPVDYSYIWGDALKEFQRTDVDARIVNLETSITVSDEARPGKGIHYRMHPQNIGCRQAANIDCYSVANNHLLDWGRDGLNETILSLDAAGIRHAGAGENSAEVASPTVIHVPGKRRILTFSFGLRDSGIPPEWAATPHRNGVNLLSDLSESTTDEISDAVGHSARQGDVIVVSLHWGGNWGYDIPEDQIHFAHRLIDAGVDVVYGHSSHHIKALEIYRGRPILY